jgi:hypothetical protein
MSALKLSGRSAILTAEGMNNGSELPLFKLALPSLPLQAISFHVKSSSYKK